VVKHLHADNAHLATVASAACAVAERCASLESESRRTSESAKQQPCLRRSSSSAGGRGPRCCDSRCASLPRIGCRLRELATACDTLKLLLWRMNVELWRTVRLAEVQARLHCAGETEMLQLASVA
jgi:hypothetical protein